MGIPTGEELEGVLKAALIEYTMVIVFVVLLGIFSILGLIYLSMHLQLGWH